MKTAVELAILLIAGLVLTASSLRAAAPVETPEQRGARMNWWREARFGMFIHWGLYAVPAGEWKGQPSKGAGEWIMNDMHIPIAEYETLLGQFNPVKFDARKWVQIAQDAGVKYIVITSKHHDGFCLFDSKVSDYDVMATPFKRDIMKELSDAAHEAGVQICWYHSIMDWHHPDAQGARAPNYNKNGSTNPNFNRYFENYLKPQCKELLSNYGKIGIMWFDGEWIDDWNEDYGKQLYDWCRANQPDVIVNNRVGKARKGMQGLNKYEDSAGDYGTPEQQVPKSKTQGDWETCMTMNETWGFKKSDDNWKSQQQLIRTLIDVASKGGNFLLNVGPTAEGEIPPPSVERLAAMGKWLKANGQAIYGTTAGPFEQPLSFGRVTQRPGKLYIHVFDWPKDQKLLVPVLSEQVKAYLLADASSSPLKTTLGEAGTTIEVPVQAPDESASVIAMEVPEILKIKAAPAAPRVTPAPKSSN